MPDTCSDVHQQYSQIYTVDMLPETNHYYVLLIHKVT